MFTDNLQNMAKTVVDLAKRYSAPEHWYNTSEAAVRFVRRSCVFLPPGFQRAVDLCSSLDIWLNVFANNPAHWVAGIQRQRGDHVQPLTGGDC